MLENYDMRLSKMKTMKCEKKQHPTVCSCRHSKW